MILFGDALFATQRHLDGLLFRKLVLITMCHSGEITILISELRFKLNLFVI